MYEDFYKLHAKPFQLNPDPVFYFASKQHQRAKAYLDYGVVRNEGFIVVTGEIGAGKTTIVRGLLDSLEASQVVAAQLVSTQVDAEDMLRLVAAAFGVRTRGVTKAELLMALEVFFVSQVGQGKRCLLIVDEAQNLTARAIEELRMLSNFQFGNQALLQSFLVGQPEFRMILQNPKMKQLRQRIVAACHIGALDRDETEAYILHRLKMAGLKDESLFSKNAHEKIFQVSAGIPRNINTFCDRLLLLGLLENRKLFDAKDVIRIEQEIREENGELPYKNSSENGTALKNEELDFHANNIFEYSTEEGTNNETLEDRSPDFDESIDVVRFRQLEKVIARLEKTNTELLMALNKVP